MSLKVQNEPSLTPHNFVQCSIKMRQQDMPRDKHAMSLLTEITDVRMQVKKKKENTRKVYNGKTE